MWAYIVLVKKWEKHSLKVPGKELRESLTTWLSREVTCENQPGIRLFSFQACASHVAFRGLSTHKPVKNFTVFTILHQTLTLNLYIKSHKHTGKWLNKNIIKFDMELNPTKI